MTEYDPPLGSLPDQDHDHDVLLVAGSRPEVARLAPVATAFNDADRIRALTVATGPDPMAVHEAFEALGVPADVTQFPRDAFDPVNPASVGAMLMTRLDELLVDLDPSAVMVFGGGMTAAIGAQVAFWRQIPIVHLQAGVASDDLLCPFPQEANRRIIGQLASLFLTTGGAALGSPIGPNAIPVGDTMAANPQPADLRFARLLRRVRTAAPRVVLVALDRLDTEPDVEVVLFGELGTHGAAAPIARHERGTVVRNVPLADLVGLLAVSAVLVSDNPELVADGPGFGTPAVLVDGPNIAEPGDSIRSILSPRVMTAVHQLLAAHQPMVAGPSDGLEAVRVEQAVAWMFGLTTSPLLSVPQPRLSEDDTAQAPDSAHREP